MLFLIVFALFLHLYCTRIGETDWTGIILTPVFHLETGPVCACNTTSPNNVTLFCSVTYAQSYIQPCYPIFKWTNASGDQVKQDQPIPMQIDPYTRRSRSQLPIASNDSTRYICELTWSAPPKAPYAYIAPAAPKFKASCSVPLV